MAPGGPAQPVLVGSGALREWPSSRLRGSMEIFHELQNP